MSNIILFGGSSEIGIKVAEKIFTDSPRFDHITLVSTSLQDSEWTVLLEFSFCNLCAGISWIPHDCPKNQGQFVRTMDFSGNANIDTFFGDD